MGLFRRKDQKSKQTASEAPTVATELTVQLYEGSASLEVVGESHHQDNLWRLAGGFTTEYVRVPCIAILVPEKDNQYDPNAIAIYISGLIVGYLPRATAADYRRGLARLMEEHGRPIALNGQIVGGGQRGDGTGMLGVFLEHDPADFVESLLTAPNPDSPHVRTGAHGFAQAGGLRWLAHVSDDDVRAIPQLRKLLVSERHPVERHYLYAQLEHHLYHSRNAFPSALEDYDAVCREHDAEMDTIRPALLDVLGGVPLLELYRQAAIRHQHARDWQTSLWWAERGIAIYGEQSLSREWAQDLSARAERCRRSLDPPTKTTRPRQPRTPSETVIESLTCGACGSDFQRVRSPGRKPTLCPPCRGEDSAPVLIG